MKKLTYLLLSVVLLGLTGCDNFLDRPSKTVMDDGNFWTSEANLRYYVNGAYTNYFVGYNSGWGREFAPGVFSAEFSDDATTNNKQPDIRLAVPPDNWFKAELVKWLYRTGAGPWNFAWIRKWNLMIERVDMMKKKGYISEEGYNHWSAVARFLRGYEYSRFVQSFGDVPYQDKVVAASDVDTQFKDRDPRTMVMTKVMEDFDYALANMRLNDGTDFLNRYVAAAFASRFMLFEGTWYIYHKGSGNDEQAKQFLEKAAKYAELVMDSGKYACDVDFRSLFGSEKQIGKEALMFRSYAADKGVTHCVASYSNLDENQAGSANLSTLKAWLCQDGKPYTESEVENAGSWDLADMAKTRDPRFEATFWDEPTIGATGVYCVKFIDREGPAYAYNKQTRPAKYGSNTNTNGVPVIRYAEVLLNWIEAKAELADKFGGAAVTQEDIDRSINVIRNRPLDEVAIKKGVKKTAPMVLAQLVDDPARTSDVEKNTLGGIVNTPLLWEIRRERRMEFFMEHFRTLDIRRWGKLELMQGTTNPDLLIGGWVDLRKTEGLKKGFNLLTSSNFGVLKVMNAKGEIITFNGTKNDKGDTLSTNAREMVGFRIPFNVLDRSKIEERNYLEPVCTDVINQYADKGYKISQNPGWN